MRTKWHRRALALLSFLLAAVSLGFAQSQNPAAGKLTLQQAVAMVHKLRDGKK